MSLARIKKSTNNLNFGGKEQITQMIKKGLLRREGHEHSEEKCWMKEEMVKDRRKWRRQSVTEVEKKRIKRRKKGK